MTLSKIYLEITLLFDSNLFLNILFLLVKDIHFLATILIII